MDNHFADIKDAEVDQSNVTRSASSSDSKSRTGDKTFDISVAQAGQHQVILQFSNGFTQPRDVILSVSNQFESVLSLPSTGSWTSFETRLIELNLDRGNHRFLFESVNGSGPQIEGLTIQQIVDDLTERDERPDGIVLIQNLVAISAVSAFADAAQANDKPSSTQQTSLGKNASEEAETSSSQKNLREAENPSNELDPIETGSVPAIGSSSSATDNLDPVAKAYGEKSVEIIHRAGHLDLAIAPIEVGAYGVGGVSSIPVSNSGNSFESTMLSNFSETSMSSVSAPDPENAVTDDEPNSNQSEGGGVSNPSGPLVGLDEAETPGTFEAIYMQAEDGVPRTGNSSGTVVRNEKNPETGNFSGLRPDYSGSGYVDYGSAAGDSYTYGFEDSVGGERVLHIRYATNDNRPLEVVVNGVSISSEPATTSHFTDTDPDGTGPDEGFNNWQIATFTITTNAGANSIILRIPASGGNAPNIDALAIALPGEIVSFTAPKIATDSLQSLENSTDAGVVAASDADGNALIYSIVGGADADKLTIDAQTGRLTFKTAPDFETPSDADGNDTFDLIVEVSDGFTSVSKPISVEVQDVLEASEPVILQIILQGEDALIVTGGESYARKQSKGLDDLIDGYQSSDKFAEGPANGTKGTTTEPIDGFGLRASYSGTGYLDFESGTDEALVWNVNVTEGGLYDLHIRFANGSEARALDIVVGGTTQHAAQSFASNGFQNWVTKTLTVQLAAGDNELKLAIAGNTNGPNIDAVALTTVGAVPVFPAANSAPEFESAAGSASAEEGTNSVIGTFAATDADGDTLTYTLEGDNAGRFSIDAAGELSFAAPTFDAAGPNSYSVTIVASDGEVTGSRTLTVTVTDAPEAPVNTAPTAAVASASTDEDQAVTIDLSGSVGDAEDGDAGLTLTASSTDGSVTVNGLQLIFTPSADFNGDATISYTVTDTGGLQTSSSVAVAVAAVNDAPVLSGTLNDATVTAGDSVVLGALTASDVDGDATILSIAGTDGATLPAGITLVDGAISVADYVAAGAYEVSVFANDGKLDSESISFTLTVEAEETVNPTPFETVIIQGESLTIVPDGDNNVSNDTLIRTRTQNQERQGANSPDLPAPNATEAPDFDEYGLRKGYTGEGYFDINGNTTGIRATFDVDAPAGTYSLHLRVANGATGTGNGFNRPIAIAVDGVQQGASQNTNTGNFANWQTITFGITLTGSGPHTIGIMQSATNGSPNIDAIALTLPGESVDFLAGPSEPTNTDPTADDLSASTDEDNAIRVDIAEAIGDADGDALTISASVPTEQGIVMVEGTELVFVPAGDFNGDAAITYTVYDGNGGMASATVSVSVAPVNDAPTLSGTIGDLTVAAGGSVSLADLTVGDVDGDATTLSIVGDGAELPAGISLVDGAIVVADDVVPGAYSISVFANDGVLDSESVSFTLTVQAEPEPEGPFIVDFASSTISSYGGTQDRGGAGSSVTVSQDGAALTLDGNLWKRASLGTDYTITANTVITVDIAIGAFQPEIVSLGFDDDDSPFETSDRSNYQLAGTQTQGGFIDLRGQGVDIGGGALRFTIDLSAHAGKSIDSLTLVADDDLLSSGQGSVTFSNVTIAETIVETGNNAPRVVGGGVGSFAVDEGNTLEVDLPFVDDDGDALTYSFAVTDANGVAFTEHGLTLAGGVLGGNAPELPGTYTIVLTADDGIASTSTSFVLTVNNVNDAPVAEDAAFEPYFFEAGTEISGIDLGEFESFFSDPDGDALTYTAEGLPEGLSLNEEGVIVGTPTQGGEFAVTIRATDPEDLSATISIDLLIEGPETGDVYTIEAEAFTGLSEAQNFYATGQAGASGDRIVRASNTNAPSTVSTDLSQNGLLEGWYTVSMTRYDETDGSASYSLTIGDTVLASNAAFDEGGSFDNSGARGNAGQAGNLKTITFETPVYVTAGAILTLSGQANGELLRTDKFTFTRVESPNLAPTAPVLDTSSINENVAGAIVGTLASTDPEGEDVAFTVDPTSDFEIVDGQLKLKDGVALDHEDAASVDVVVTATDAQGKSSQSTLKVTVADVNETPVLADGISIDDFEVEAGNAETIDLAVLLSATDPDEGATISYVATLADGSALPAGLSIDGTGLVIDGTLPAGAYEVRVFATDGELDSESVSFTLTVAEPGVFNPVTIQAESGDITLTQAADDNSTQVRDPDNTETNPNLPTGLRPDFTGTGYLDFGNDAGDTVSYSVTVAEAGTYDLAIRYATNTDRPLDFTVNGGTATQLPFVATDPDETGLEEGFDHWQIQTVSVQLNAGENTLSFAIPASANTGPNLDAITISKPGAVADSSADADDFLLDLDGPTGELNETQAASINFNVTGEDDDIVKIEISFDGGATRIDVTAIVDADGDFVVDGSDLAAGAQTATIIVTDGAGNEASATHEFSVAGPDVSLDPIVVEAESGAIALSQASDANSTQVRDPANPETNPALQNGLRPDFTGSGYVDFGNDAGDTVTFNVNAVQAGTYTLSVRYATNSDRPLDLSVNGGTVQSLPFLATGTNVSGPAEGFNNWAVQTVTVELAAGANTLSLAIPAEAITGPNIDKLTFTYADEGTGTPTPPFSVTVEGETFAIGDIEANATTPADTVARTPENPETGGAPGSATRAEFDEFGLRPGYEGNGYLDMGNDVGDQASFAVEAPSAGTYQLTVRYVNGGTDGRPMTLTVNGIEQTINFGSTQVQGGVTADHWSNWTDVTVDVELTAGSNAISLTNTIANGPNIDNVTISRAGTDGGGGETETPADAQTFNAVVKINFEAPTSGNGGFNAPAGYTTPTGYLADTGAAFGNRGNGFSYGWVDVENGAVTDNALAQPTGSARYKNDVPGASDLQKTYLHFEYPGADASNNERAFELALENGTYQVQLSIGDTGGRYDSTYVVNVEGQSFMPSWIPVALDGESHGYGSTPTYSTSYDGEGFRSTLVTGLVTVTDGRLTIDSIGGYNTEIQYLQVEKVPDLTPDDNRSADLDYSKFVDAVAASNESGQVSIEIGENGEVPLGIDPTSSLVVGVQLQAIDHRGPSVAYVDGIRLYETLTGIEVPINVQVSGGTDSLTIRPLVELKEFTSYTLDIADVLDAGDLTDSSAPQRQMQDYTTTFVTGEAPEVEAREVAFTDTVVVNGITDGAAAFTSIEFGPDGKLYVSDIMGNIHRWAVNSDGTVDNASKETLDVNAIGQTQGRSVIGLVFDPEDPNTIWITDNAPVPREGKADQTPEFSGQVSRITLGENGSFTGAEVQTYITGLPRSGGDHVTNSLEFRNIGTAADPEYMLYVMQGSNSAAGRPDNAWGFRPERLLNAAALEIDPRREPDEGGFNVQTEPYDPATNDPTYRDSGAFNADGTVDGYYNPFAADAVLKIFGEGIRNGYDLVWHSNGNLYVPTNGTARGGNTLDDPNTPINEQLSNLDKQYDYLFQVQRGGYYGHPNSLLGHYVVNGGAGGADNIYGDNNSANTPDGGNQYAPGVVRDPDYDIDGAYSLDFNRSPNGAVEYTGNAFGTNLKGAILIAQFSVGDNVRVINVDPETGRVIGDDVLRRPGGDVIDEYIDPLDIIENPLTGQLYLMTLNRGTGESIIVLLNPAPGGVTQDITADAGNDLTLLVIDSSDPSDVLFQVTGLDDDIEAITVSFDGGANFTSVSLTNGRFLADLTDLGNEVEVVLRVEDEAGNIATTATNVAPGSTGSTGAFLDATAFTVISTLTGDDATVIRNINDPSTYEPGNSNDVNGDGMNDNYDGQAYLDPNGGVEDKASFTFDAAAAGTYTFIFRMANGDGNAAPRPIAIKTGDQNVTIDNTQTGSFTTWNEFPVTLRLEKGVNTITIAQTSANGAPNIDSVRIVPDQLESSTPNDGEIVVGGVTYVKYEAENAVLDGPVVVSENRTQSGDFVDFDGTTDQSITWTVEVTEAGSYGLDILYALGVGKAARPMTLSVDGQTLDTLAFAANSNTAETAWGPQSTTVQLSAGVHTITVTAPGANGPNVDYLRLSKAPIDVFEPSYAAIDGEGRIELEATDGTTQTLNANEVVFYFTVDADGVYALDVAANANAADGAGLTFFLNGVELEDTDFPGVGDAGEESVYAQLVAGTQYKLAIRSDSAGANGLDYLDIRPAPGNANADIAVQSLDPAYFDNRLHFSYLENPDAVNPDGPDREFKDSGTVRLTNTGTEALTLTDYELDGPFVLANSAQLDGLSIAPGSFVDVTVLFNRAAYSPPTSNVDGTSTIFQGSLKLVTNDADDPITTIDLAGFWQARDEGGQEPNINEVWQIFGFGNVIEGLRLQGGGESSVLDFFDLYIPQDETEVLSPYWRLADGVGQARITQIAAFHGPSGATLGIHAPGNKDNGSEITFTNHAGDNNQSILPVLTNGNFASAVFNNGTIPNGWAGNEVFGIEVAGLSTDPRLNPTGNGQPTQAQLNAKYPGQGYTVQNGTVFDADGNEVFDGYTVRMFQAVDADGNVIPNVFLGVMDYTGINYDYNDNMFVIEGVTPVGFGQTMVVSGLDDAAADERLIFTNIDNPADGSQQFRNEAVVTIANDGFAPLTIDAITLGVGLDFEIVGAVPTLVAAGSSAQITVRFVGTHDGTSSGASLLTSTLTIESDAYAGGSKVIQLAGLAQEFSERGSEPTVAQIVEALGYSTDVAQEELAGSGVVETIGDEVLLPYLQRLDGSRPVEVIQIAAFLNQGNIARLGFHSLDSATTTNLMANDDQQGQTVMPDQLVPGTGAGGTARGVINSDAPFGLHITVDGRPTYASWTDPQANNLDPSFGNLVGDNQGHLIRFFQAIDAAGNAIEGTFIGIQDYPGAGNYDYNDHMFVIKNVQAYELTAADDANGDGVNDALQNDTDNDGTVDFFDPDNNTGGGDNNGGGNTGGGENRGDYVFGVNFGGGAIANDPVLGVALAAQSDSRVTVSGSVNPGAGLDQTSNPNGANAVAGSAFKTYEDGSNWTASISVPNGTYIVVLHTQETYWNSAGQRQFDAFVNGQQVIDDLDPFAQAGGDTPIAVEAVVTVTNGVISINMDSAGSDGIDNAPLNAVTIYEYVDDMVASQSPFGGTAPVVDADGTTIDASNYDQGGQGIAYNDAAGLQGGNNGGRAGSDVEQTSGGDIGWIATGEWLEYTIDLEAAGEYDLDLLLSNGGTGSSFASVAFYRAGDTTPYATSGSIASPSTGSWTNFVSRGVDGIELEAGLTIVRVTFTGGQDFRSFTLTPVAPPAPAQSPYGGTAPGFSNGALTVDATNFDEGGQGIAYNDNAGLDGGNQTLRPGRDVEFVGSQNDIGHVKPGEWVEYTVDVPSTGTYTFTANAKTPVAGATIAVSLADGAVLGTVALADGNPGGSSFSSAAFAESAPITLQLPAGQQTLRLTFDGPLASNGYVLDLRSFTLEQGVDGQSPVNGPHTVDGDGLIVDASDYDLGGQGVAYNDAPGLQGGNNGGRAGSSVEQTAAGDIGWIENGEWLEYTIEVDEAGAYLLSLSAAQGSTGGAQRTITATFEQNGTVYETANAASVNPTGSWTTFQDTQSVLVDLEEGTQTVRLTFNGGSMDLRSFEIDPLFTAMSPVTNVDPEADTAPSTAFSGFDVA
ncbi:carbohydrate-binding protein [Fulvimarina sp. 2208YS6-2-32]|uniref:Carbohydrate-binding protein n=1 Tax=Fulvimarina uroteuthidis TaxID=3098149 RepID=A0ABU5I2H0_9HYPH|nr:carbohydrate-binding protein [Fulvimarina sp. 2208YS6-2-32]MDY8108968.1 carbohydrate-binding protein [Fulvimarina sp. 2208YS6-2-32]